MTACETQFYPKPSFPERVPVGIKFIQNHTSPFRFRAAWLMVRAGGDAFAPLALSMDQYAP
jgi:hypothetical protein